MAGIYIHIPFCRQKCGYCDFYSVTAKEHAIDAYIMQVNKEIESQRNFLPTPTIETIYFGGGTPSLCTSEQIDSVIETIRNSFKCQLKETTLEANPDDLSIDYLRSISRTSIDRLSIGIQSFQDEHLRYMNRRHNSKTAIEAVRRARGEGFDNISIDLMYGVPGMTMAQWRCNIEIAIGLGVEHISAYHLIVEDNTPFGRRLKSGEMTLVDDQVGVEQFLLLRKLLIEAGYEHYEISNFSLPEKRALHNSSYWTGVPYLGVGAGAHSYDGSLRRFCDPSLGRYLVCDDFEQLYSEELLSPTDIYNEYVMTRLRRSEGIDTKELGERFGERLLGDFKRKAKRYVSNSQMSKQGERYAISGEHFMISDLIISDLFAD